MTLIPYSRQEITEDDRQAVIEALCSDFVTQGPRIGAFEAEFAERHEVKHAVAVSNATAGLHLACLALDVGPGSRVWTSPISFVASANCAIYCGAEVDFVDIDPHTRNMSIRALEEKLAEARAANRLPHVIVAVDFAGLPTDLRELRKLADEYGFKIIEDASHATGASYLGRPVGADFVDIAVFSFHAVKIITTAEGGIVTTADDSLARKLRLLRTHGITREMSEMQGRSHGPWYYEQQMLGFNYRMTDVQAALGLSQLRRLPKMHARRDRLAHRYDELLEGLPLILPKRLPDRVSAWHLYVVEIDDTRTKKTRFEIFGALRAAGIGVNVHYIPIHLQPFYRRRGFASGDFPMSERYYERALTLPLFPSMTENEQDYVVRQLSTALTPT